MSTLKKILLDKDSSCKSIWFMRQAGRYLPEFRKIRSQNTNFIDLCLNSDLSSEITLQPIKRYNIDSAIIFSDILLVPFAMGQEVEFIKDKGPVLSAFSSKVFFKIKKNIFLNRLSPIYKSINKTRINLDKHKSLIGFVGAPWTLLIYMLGLKKENNINFSRVDNKNLNIDRILDKLIEYLCLHIEHQINAGADVIQIFDSWAGLLPEDKLEKFCYLPNLKIVNFCKSKKIPTICFPKGIKENYLDFYNLVRPEGLSLDHDIKPLWAKEKLTDVVLQGGMHPKVLFKTEDEIYEEAKIYLDTFKNVPYIFNLGHGIMPGTNPDKLGKLIKFVKDYK